jgi:single-strand DNA-binding protein
MSSINRVVITGRLTRDPELRTTTTGKQVVSFSVACDRRVKSEEGKDADFFRVTAWNQTAEFIANYAHKGRMVGVDGRLQQRKYTNKDGIEVEAIEIVADNVTLLDRPRDDAAGGEKTAAVAAVGAETGPDDYDPFEEE